MTHRTVAFLLRRRKPSLHSFSLVELLTVIAIIAILTAITLGAAGGVMNLSARKRAMAEIKAMEGGLESYKSDNGTYPIATFFAGTTTYCTNNDPSTGSGNYQQSSQTLYQALSGKTNFLDIPVAGIRAYMPFKTSQLGNTTTPAGTAIAAATSTYVQDPWGYSYGYYCTTNGAPATLAPYNGVGFADIWSTGGTIGGATGKETNVNAWVGNWTSQ